MVYWSMMLCIEFILYMFFILIPGVTLERFLQHQTLRSVAAGQAARFDMLEMRTPCHNMYIQQCPSRCPLSPLHLCLVTPLGPPPHKAMRSSGFGWNLRVPANLTALLRGTESLFLNTECSINHPNADSTLSPQTSLVMTLSCQNLSSPSHLHVIWIAVKRLHKERISCLLHHDRHCPLACSAAGENILTITHTLHKHGHLNGHVPSDEH